MASARNGTLRMPTCTSRWSKTSWPRCATAGRRRSRARSGWRSTACWPRSTTADIYSFNSSRGELGADPATGRPSRRLQGVGMAKEVHDAEARRHETKQALEAGRAKYEELNDRFDQMERELDPSRR